MWVYTMVQIQPQAMHDEQTNMDRVEREKKSFMKNFLSRSSTYINCLYSANTLQQFAYRMLIFSIIDNSYMLHLCSEGTIFTV